MPKERIYTSNGYVEVSWYGGGGGLVCIESAEREGEEPYSTQMHQITDRDSMRSLLKVLRRASRQEFEHENHDGHGCIQDPSCIKPTSTPPA